MLYYLDTMIVIYAVEGLPPNLQRTRDHLLTLTRAGHRFMVSELTRSECLVPVFGQGEELRLANFLQFFQLASVRTTALTSSMHERAAAIRGAGLQSQAEGKHPTKKYGLIDALHLAVAIESGCDVFLTNDDQLSGFPDIAVESLP